MDKKEIYAAEILERKIQRFVRETGKEVDEVVMRTARMVCESAAKATPPGKGAVISREKFTRRLLTMSTPEGDPIGYAVAIRATDRRATKKIYFKDCASRAEALQKAQTYQTIFARGIAKAGWWLALKSLGQTPAGYNYGRDVPAKASEINAVQIHPRTLANSQTIEVANRVQSISRFGDIALRIGLKNARIRLDWWLRELQGKAVKNSGVPF